MSWANVSEQQSSSYIYANFPEWFKHQVSIIEPTRGASHLRGLARGPERLVKEYHTYFVNGYKFHTHAWTVGKKTYNNGVYVKGVREGGVDDFYGVIKNIYELSYQYVEHENKVVLFYCDWFDPSRNGTKIDLFSKIVDIRMDKRYNAFDPFIMAHNVKQVYYVPYPSFQQRKRGWCAAIKTNPRGHIETNIPIEEAAYQDNEMSSVPNVVEVEPITGLLVDQEVDGQEVEVNLLDDNEEVTNSSEDNMSYDGGDQSRSQTSRKP